MVSVKRVYGLTTPFVSVFPDPITKTAAPTAADKNYPNGFVWIYKNGDTRTSYMYGGLDSSGDAVWILAGPGASDVDLLKGDSGTATPLGGIINILGGTNMTTVGASPTGDDLTVNMDASITLATQVSSPIYTVAAATDMNINAASGKDIIMVLGDNVGTNKFIIQDSSAMGSVFAVDSNGGLTMAAVTFTGLLTAQASATIETAGTALNLGSDNDAGAVNLGVGTTARAIGIGNSAAAHILTIGSTTGAASLDLKAGEGNFTLDGVAATTYAVGAATTTGTITIGGTSQTGTFTLGGSDGAMTMNIANADGKKTINFGDGVDGNDIDIGNGINTSAQTLDIANGAAAANSTVNILSGVATAGTQTLNLGNGDYAKTVAIADGVLGNTVTIANGINSVAQTVSIANGASAAASTVSILSGIGTAGASVLALGNNTRVTTIGLGNIAPAAARTTTLLGGNSAQNDTFNLLTGNPSANAQTVNIMSGVPSGGTQVMNLLTQTGQSGTINVATGAAMANAINIGGTGANVIALGNTQTAGSIALGDAMTSGTIAIGGSGLQTGTITLAGGTGAQTLNIATGGTGIKTVNVATGAIGNVVTIGSVTGAASLSLLAGTGEITITGTVKDIQAEHIFSSGTDLTVTQSAIMQSNLTTGVAPSGADGDVNIMGLQDGCFMEQFIIGTQTIIAPRMSATGLDIELDNTPSEGAEYNFGARANAKHAYTIGTSAAFFFSATITVTTLTGCGPLMVGFRKVQANNKVIADYTDYFCAGMNAATSATEVVLLDELNGGGQTITNSTTVWTGGDTGTCTIKVLVSAAGVCTYTIDGGAPAVTNAVTFDNTDVVMPFIHFLNGADVAGAVSLNALSCGFQA